jgi:hypothetical protein
MRMFAKLRYNMRRTDIRVIELELMQDNGNMVL